ncbi:MAG: SsrA-binding protein [Glaciecola sp.]|jgi:SsrA-binding protein
MSKEVNIKNKKASYLYEFLDTFICGIVLSGTEIKSIRNGKASINEAFCAYEGDELVVRNMYIAPFEHGGHYNHYERQDRKLLLKRSELDKWKKKLKNQGLTIIPRKVFISKKGWAKIQIVLAKGKNVHDKRQDMKNKDSKREMDRIKSGKY